MKTFAVLSLFATLALAQNAVGFPSKLQHK